MKRPNNLFLIGPAGAGKSSIGKQLAQHLKMDFWDVDQEIEQGTGADIAWIFDVEGEEGFRRREQSMLDALTKKQGIILATGGGAILSAQNRKNLVARGTVIYLYTTVEQQIRRTAKDKRRPLLQKTNKPEDTLRICMDERDPLYREIADIVISTDVCTVRAVVNDIIHLFETD